MKKLIVLLLLVGCSNPPAPKTVELDLCKARAAFKLAEVVEPNLAPAPGSLRAQLEADEDAFCVTLTP